MPIIAGQQSPTPKRKKSSPWGLLVIGFAALTQLFPHLVAPLLQLVRTPAAGLPPGLSGALPWVLGGLFVALLVVPSVVRQARRSRTQSDGRLATTMQPAAQMQSPQVARRRAGAALSPQKEAMPQQALLRPNAAPAQPRPLRYESTINGKVVVAGLIWGGLVAGGLLFLRLLRVF